MCGDWIIGLEQEVRSCKSTKSSQLFTHLAYLFVEVLVLPSYRVEQALHQTGIELSEVSMTQGKDLDMRKRLGNSPPISGTIPKPCHSKQTFGQSTSH